MQISEVMTKRVATVEMDDDMKLVKGIFDAASFRHLLVVNAERLVGVLSDRDLLKCISPNIGTLAEETRDTQTLNTKVHQVMSRQLITLTEEASVKEAIKLFNNNRISCIPIIGKDHKPVGIVSWRDIFRSWA